MKINDIDLVNLLKELTETGITLSREKDHTKLLEFILFKAKSLTNADGATLYECGEDRKLHFKIMFTESLGIHLGGTSPKKIQFQPLSLYNDDGSPNEHMVATSVATRHQSVNIEDVYNETHFDFSGTYAWDKQIGYRSKSFLTIPMTNHLNEVIGVLQLINARDITTGEVISFSILDQQIAESLASQAAVSLTNQQLIEEKKELFDALIKLIANAIDEKSPYTGGHCRRVPVITKLIAQAMCEVDKGPLKQFTLNDDEKYELEVSAWLHDCGKICTPEFVVDKATKLETIFDRIHLVDLRFEILKRDAIIQCLRDKANAIDLSADSQLRQTLQQLDEERDFIRTSNIGKETITDPDLLKIKMISTHTWLSPSGKKEPLLNEEELANLEIFKGTLSNRERNIINNHVVLTRKMLDSLPYPKNMKRVPEFAGNHHEKMDGTGYPLGLVRAEMPIQSRIIAIADVFEALTASDRPYKKAMPLSQALTILGKMKLEGHIDPDIFDVFMDKKIYLEYASHYLSNDVMDEVDVTKIPGYSPLKD